MTTFLCPLLGKEVTVMLERYYMMPGSVDRIRALWLGPAIERYAAWLADRRISGARGRGCIAILIQFNRFARAHGAREWSSLPHVIFESPRTRFSRQIASFDETEAPSPNGCPDQSIPPGVRCIRMRGEGVWRWIAIGHNLRTRASRRRGPGRRGARTLYGRNTTTGAISFVARKSSNKFDANASLTHGLFNEVDIADGVRLTELALQVNPPSTAARSVLIHVHMDVGDLTSAPISRTVGSAMAASLSERSSK